MIQNGPILTEESIFTLLEIIEEENLISGELILYTNNDTFILYL